MNPPRLTRTLALAVALGVALGLAAPSVAQQQTRVVDHRDPLVRSDIAYRRGADSSQSLDLYAPDPRPATPFPTVVFIHGGSLTSGDRRDLPHATICNNFVHAGMACAAINYRLVQQAKWPAPPQDVAAAIAWISKNIAARGGDPQRIYLFGHSSGCHLAALIATDTTYLALHHLSPRDLAGVVAMGCLHRIHLTALTMMQDPLDPTFMRIVDFVSGGHR